MTEGSFVISVVATLIALCSLSVAISSNRKSGPRLKVAAKLRKSVPMSHGLKLELSLFNTGLAASRIGGIYLFDADLFGPTKVSPFAVEEGAKDVDGHEIAANDGSRWLIDLDRVLRAASDEEILRQYYRFRRYRSLPGALLDVIIYFAMSATVVLMPRAIKRNFLQVVVVFRNGLELRKPVTTGWILQFGWLADLAKGELERQSVAS